MDPSQIRPRVAARVSVVLAEGRNWGGLCLITVRIPSNSLRALPGRWVASSLRPAELARGAGSLARAAGQFIWYSSDKPNRKKVFAFKAGYQFTRPEKVSLGLGRG